MKTSEKTVSRPKTTLAKKHKSIMGSLKYAIKLPYKTNAVDLVRKNR